MIKLKDLGSSKEVLVVAKHKIAIFKSDRTAFDTIIPIVIEGCTYAQQKANVERFLRYARARPRTTYWITSSLGNAVDFAPMFAEAPANCYLPVKWKEHLPGRLEKGRWWFS
jgi:hypothetical protein